MIVLQSSIQTSSTLSLPCRKGQWSVVDGLVLISVRPVQVALDRRFLKDTYHHDGQFVVLPYNIQSRVHRRQGADVGRRQIGVTVSLRNHLEFLGFCISHLYYFIGCRNNNMLNNTSAIQSACIYMYLTLIHICVNAAYDKGDILFGYLHCKLDLFDGE